MMGKRKVFNCIYCARPVTGRHHAIACDVCGEWQHRKCQTEISYEDYREMVKGRIQISWKCHGCDTQPSHSGEEHLNSTSAVPQLRRPTLELSTIIPEPIATDTDTNEFEHSFRHPEVLERETTQTNNSTIMEVDETYRTRNISQTVTRNLTEEPNTTNSNLSVNEAAAPTDGTFKIVKRPFYQLFSIHGYVTKEECVKQIPLLYVLMTRRTKKDYTEVFRRLSSQLDDPLVEWVMLDFEAATWQAIRDVFPAVIVKGCVFHWTQRIYKKLSQLGLSTAYTERKDKHAFLRKLMSLPFLPQEHIIPAFNELKQQAASTQLEPFIQLTNYIQATWIEGLWTPVCWSVFRETVRTNNEVEGWHRRINGKAGRPGLGFYTLVPLLLAEADEVNLQMRLVSENLLNRIHRKQYKRIHGKLFELWDKYEDGDITTSQLLRASSKLTGLGPSVTSSQNYEYE